MLEALFLMRRVLQYSVHSDHFILRLDNTLYEVNHVLPVF